MRLERKILWICAVLALLCGMAGAQDAKKENRLRTVRGVVTDKSEKPIANAIVFLKNLRTNAVISHFSDEQGNYRFSGLDPNADYELRAEFEGEKSASRTISSLDSRKEMNLNLKIDRKIGLASEVHSAFADSGSFQRTAGKTEASQPPQRFQSTKSMMAPSWRYRKPANCPKLGDVTLL